MTNTLVKPFRFSDQPYEYAVRPVRECPMPEDMSLGDTPELAANYWRTHVESDARFDPERECLVVLLLNIRRRIKGHQLVSIGTGDTILVAPVSVFRLAVITSASAIIVMHNHPSGDPTPSDGDIKVTRDLMRGGKLLKVEVLDHIVMGNCCHKSLRELGFFYA